MLNIYNLEYPNSVQTHYHYTPSFITKKKKLHYTFYGLCMAHLQTFLHLQLLHLYYHTQQIYDQVNMALMFTNEHIAYYHMDALRSMALA